MADNIHMIYYILIVCASVQIGVDMKKVCFVSLFIVLMLGVYYVSYIYSVKYFSNDGNDYKVNNIPTQAVDANSEEIISNVTEYVIEYYNIDTKSLTEEKLSTPIQYLGYTREKLIKALKTYMITPTLADKAQGLISFELASFSSKKVIVRKSFSTADLPSVYYIFVENGYLTIYLEDKTTLYDNTTIKLSNLPESIQKEIVNGKKIISQKELYNFLETYTS